MIRNHYEVLGAIENLREVRVSWRSKDDAGRVQVRRCAPMDYGPSRRAKDQSPRYHFWDFESDSERNHVLSLRADVITSVDVLETQFVPSEFVTWSPRWFVPRSSWGVHN